MSFVSSLPPLLYQSLPFLYVKLPLYKNQLSRSSECAANAVQILEVLFQFLIDEFVDYALEIGLQVFKINSQMIYLQNKLGDKRALDSVLGR